MPIHSVRRRRGREAPVGALRGRQGSRRLSKVRRRLTNYTAGDVGGVVSKMLTLIRTANDADDRKLCPEARGSACPPHRLSGFFGSETGLGE